MPSMSPLITSPVPSVGSVVPNMQNAAIILNGISQAQALEVRLQKDMMGQNPAGFSGCLSKFYGHARGEP